MKLKILKLIGTYINNKDGGIETRTIDVSRTLTYKGRECEWRTITDCAGRRHVVLCVKPEN